MSTARLILRNLRFFWRGNLAVLVGVAVGSAVLTGALMVGDSVRQSLRELAIRRLGPVDHVLVATRFFPQDLADRLTQTEGFDQRYAIAPAVLVTGGAANEVIDEDQKRRLAQVQIAGVGGDWVPVPRGGAILNGEVAGGLGLLNRRDGASAVDGGDAARRETSLGTVLLTMPAMDDLPRESALAHRSRSRTIAGMRLEATGVVSEPGMLALFHLAGTQRTPRNVWVNLQELQQAIGQERRVNALLVHARDGNLSADDLDERLRRVIRLEDYGLQLQAAGDGTQAALTSSSTYLLRPVQQTAIQAAEALNIPLQQVSVYLLNRLEKVEANASEDEGQQGGGRTRVMHYLVAAGIDVLSDGPLGDDEIALNEWTAKQIGARIGDKVRFAYYRRQRSGDLVEVSSDGVFTVARILPMSGLGADPSLTPVYPGLTDADSVSDWDPPEGLTIDKSLVSADDEAYWDQYRAAPKAFVSLKTASRLWGETYAQITSVRVPIASADAFASELLKRLDPSAMGMRFEPIKAQQLSAASGSTDFAMLFVGFSFFLIASAMLLVAMLFRLNLQTRARQIGLLSAVGFTPGRLRRLHLIEGVILAAAGGLIGLIGAIGYTALMMAGLRTWWLGAIGTAAMRLHVEPRTLLIGWALSVAIALMTLYLGARRIGRASTSRLLARGAGAIDETEAGRRGDGASGRHPAAGIGRFVFSSLSVAVVLALLAGALLAMGMADVVSPQGAFMGGGAMLLAAALFGLRWWLLAWRGAQRSSSSLSVALLALRNTWRYPTRSLSTIALIGCAAFILVTVAAMKQLPPDDPTDPHCGTGGFSLILQADIPLLGDLGTRSGRQLLAVGGAGDALWDSARFVSMRSWAGQDISCLNLTRPTSPTILAVPDTLARENRFSFAGAIRRVDNPWLLLEGMDEDGAIPVIADHETAQYILHLKVGQTMSITDEAGIPRTLRLVATLKPSIFQSQLLMGEENFRRLFPSQSGFGVVLIDAPPQHADELTRRLANGLDEYAVTIDRTGDRLAMYQQVANTYLSTFQTLGALGLMLGTIGLAIVLLRSLVERRGELTLLAALGFRPGLRVRLVLTENACLLLAGLLVGALCATLGVLPARRAINVTSLAAVLAMILAIGLLVLAIATYLGQRRVSPGDLRQE